MYKTLVRPVLFLFPPETIHKFIVFAVKSLFLIPGIRATIRSYYKVNDRSLETEVFGLTFGNPVGLAAGFDKNAEVFSQFEAFGFSFIEVGTVTPKGQPGNPKPRSFRLRRDRGLINRMGFNNHGVDRAARNLLRKRPKDLILGGNIGKNTLTPNEDAAGDYKAVFESLYDLVDYFVVNVSCPNISDLRKLQDQESLEQILTELMQFRQLKSHKKPVLLKISPDLNTKQLDETLDLLEKLELDGIVATNTTITREGLKTSQDRIKEIGAGGLSGAPITDRSLEVVRYIHERTSGAVPIIAVGGIMSVKDALNMLDAGASLIQLYTGFIYEGPGLARKINRELLKRNSCEKAISSDSP